MFDHNFGKIETSVIEIDDKGKQLPADEAKFVILSLQNVTSDSAQAYTGGLDYTGNKEIYWGFEGNCFHQLFPTQTTPFLIPVTNLSDIHLKARQGQTATVYFTFFR